MELEHQDMNPLDFELDADVVVRIRLLVRRNLEGKAKRCVQLSDQ